MATIAAAPGEPAGLASGVSTRVLRLLKAQVEDWYDVCRRLANWEDNLLVGKPALEQLTEHARLLDELEQVGGWLSKATGGPDFPDHATAELIKMTLRDLNDVRSLWHGKLTKEQREEILRTVFNES